METYTKSEKKEAINTLIAAIKEFGIHPERLENLDNYLNNHFEIWFEKYVKTPYGLISELKAFSEIE